MTIGGAALVARIAGASHASPPTPLPGGEGGGWVVPPPASPVGWVVPTHHDASTAGTVGSENPPYDNAIFRNPNKINTLAPRAHCTPAKTYRASAAARIWLSVARGVIASGSIVSSIIPPPASRVRSKAAANWAVSVTRSAWKP